MIYFIRDEASGYVKIGFANDPWKRLSKIQSDTPAKVAIVALEDGGVGRESELHSRFATCRARGEWFRPAPELLAYIAELGVPERSEERQSKTRAYWGGYTDADIARRIKISTPHLSDIRTGKRRPSPELAMELQRLTGRSAIEFIFGDTAAEALAHHGMKPLERAA